MLLDADGVTLDLRAARDALGRSCAAGDAEGCAWLADRMAATGAPSADVLATATRACDGGSARACVALGTWTAIGLGTPKDEARANEYRRRARNLLAPACEEGDPDACVQLASGEELGWVDSARAAALDGRAGQAYAKLCDDGDVPACAHVAGRALLSGPLFGPISEAQSKLWSRICDLDVASVCLLLSHGGEDSVARDRSCRLGLVLACKGAAAQTLKAAACDDGEGEACSELAEALERAGADPAEPERLRARARKLLAAACSLYRGNCYLEAMMAEKAVGGPVDLDEAVAALEVPCKAAGHCDALGELLLRSPDPARATRGVALLEASCAERAEDCLTLASAFEHGGAVAKDAKRAREFATRAVRLLDAECAAGTCTACVSLADLYTSGGVGVAKSPKKAGDLRAKACGGGCRYACAGSD